MSPLHPARRSAERFDSLVEGGSGSLDGVDARTAELLELVGALRSVPEVAPRAEFTASLRERLMSAAETELVPARDSRLAVERKLTVAPRTKRHHERRLGVAIGAFAIVGASTGMAVAAQGTVPGDVLYPVKRIVEQAESGFHTSDQAKGRSLLDHATSRLGEATTLTQRDDVDASSVREALEAFTDQAEQGSDLLIKDYRDNQHRASITDLRTFTATSVTTLAGLEGSVPEPAHDALVAAAQAMFTIDAAAESACPDCSAQGVTEMPGNLLAAGQSEAQKALDDATAVAPDQATDGNGKGGTVSGIDPPKNPVKVDPTKIKVPTSVPTQGTTTTTTPTQGTPPISVPTQGTQSNSDGNGTTGKGNGNTLGNTLGNTVSELPSAIATGVVDPVTGTVNNVVTGVVQTVNGLLTGLTGTLTGPGVTATVPPGAVNNGQSGSNNSGSSGGTATNGGNGNLLGNLLGGGK
jgi:hypothetical protein